MDSAASGVTVSSESGLLVVVKMAGTEGLFKESLYPFFGAYKYVHKIPCL